MSIEQHFEDRTWALEALDELQAFLNDPDFEGDAEEERRFIERKRKELKDGKYRVVILGEFNVGKSALVNAFLGDEYLPMVLEECTTKITHVLKGESLKLTLNLSTPALQGEIDTLTRLIDACGVSAAVSANEEMTEVVVAFEANQARDLVRTLRPLVTMAADEDFPQLKVFRTKFDEIYIQLPTDVLEEDVALVDSPGVHSISETNTKIAEEIIPDSHLVICMLDSQSPGTEQNRAFIEKVVKHRHRKLLFVINKADQLNPEEIDPKGHRGPARDLFRSLKGVVDAPELFFVSALYALVSSQLSRFQLMLPDLDNNQKIKIPWAVQKELMAADEPTKGVADYLMAQSNIGALRDRLLNYLYTENREGAIVESSCRFIDDRAWTYARPLQVKLDMARDVPRLEELKQQREAVSAQIDEHVRRGEAVDLDLKDMSGGGTVNGRDFPGYEGLLKSRISDATIKEAILDPARAWLFKDANYSKAKKGRFAPFATEVERLVDTFLQDACETLNAEVAAVETAALEKTGPLRRQLDVLMRIPIEAPRPRIGELKAGLCGSYVGFLLLGGILGAIAGSVAVIGGALGQLPDMDMTLQIAAGAGAGVGALLGLILRCATAKGVRRSRLINAINLRVKQALLGQEKSPGIREQFLTALEARRAEFAESIRDAFDTASEDLRSQRRTIEDEEDILRANQEAIISCIEPKLETLSELGRRAAETAEVNAPRGVGAAL